ncbi:AraC family transcriptional regulator [Flagellimonas sp. 389]|uniref:helix-turn-helix domain-containing protein n=1 Tax=Flagellimonas sp. 389 TaxID=2835862 RepID=UPI001BD565DF|nr:helix-turn-helix domain-containing protein [uncultured Allomuricauda sp.]MBS9461125.1 AraC family transcriptional regulator [Flagellimonas sp. 389]
MNKDTIILVLSCLGLVQALFLFIYLITLKKGRRKANVFLAFIILGVTIRIGKSVLNTYFHLEPWQRNLGLSGILLTGPSLWFYGKVLFDKSKMFSQRNYLHLIPFGTFMLLCALIPNRGDALSYGIYIAIFLHLLVYIGLSVYIMYKNGKEIRSQLSKWYRNLILGISIIWGFYMGHLSGLFSWYIGGAIFFSFLIYIFSFLFLQKHAFQLGKYTKSTLDSETSRKLVSSLKNLFAQEEMYLHRTISLEIIAEKLNTPPRKLSQAINENEQKNFSEFVNQYRIEKAKQLLSEPNSIQQKIATIAYDCGFGNVTSFNLAFKAITQLTPSEYRSRFST